MGGSGVRSVWAVLFVWALSALLPSGLGQMLRNPGCTTALSCQTRQCLSGLTPVMGVRDHCFLPLHISCVLVVPALWHCRDVCWGLFERPSLLFLRLNSSQEKAPDNNIPLGGHCVPLAWPTLSSPLSHGHSLQAAPNPYLMSTRLLKCHSAFLLTPHGWGESLWCFFISTPQGNTSDCLLTLSVHLYHV